MKILIDIQSLQTIGSSKRGIGRYSLNLLSKLLETSGNHKIVLLSNISLSPSDAILELIAKYEGKASLYEWQSPKGSAFLESKEDFRFIAREIYKEVISNVDPDVHLILSPFEGLGDDVIWSVNSDVPSVAIFYDAIPAIFPNEYLAEKPVMTWYQCLVDQLKQVQGLISISESSKCDADKYLNLNQKAHISVKAGLDEVSMRHSAKAKEGIRLPKDNKYIFSVLGEDFRKNKKNLINAFGTIVKDPEFEHNLFIAYKQSSYEKQSNEKLLKDLSLSNRVFFLDYIDDEELFSYYANADLFVFPSLYEGLGLPILEAQACGVPVIGSNSSSINEIIENNEFLFDPKRPEEIANCIQKIIASGDLRKQNILESKAKVEEHSSLKAGQELWKFFDSLIRPKKSDYSLLKDRIRVAFFTPIIPQKTGIATHADELIPYLANKYSLTVITEGIQFTANYDHRPGTYEVIPIENFQREEYDILLFNMGNSQFHIKMADALQRFSGIVIMHDVFLSGLVWMCLIESNNTKNFPNLLYSLGGLSSTWSLVEKDEHMQILETHSLNSEVMGNAQAVVVHSNFAKEIISNGYRHSDVSAVRVVPQQRSIAAQKPKAQRKPSTEFVFATFGAIADSKMYFELLSAWRGSLPEMSGTAKLFFVGQDLTYDIGQVIDDLSIKNTVEITGYLEPEEYNDYLARTDVGIQLRKSSRGETSRALLDLLSYGKPAVINRNGSFAEYGEYGVLSVNDKFDVDELRQVLDRLFVEEELRKSLGERNLMKIEEVNSPENYLDNLNALIYESFALGDRGPEAITLKIRKASKRLGFLFSDSETQRILESILNSFSHAFVKQKIFIDITQYTGVILLDKEKIRLRSLFGEFVQRHACLDIRFVFTPDSGLTFLDYPAFLSLFCDIDFALPETSEIDIHEVRAGFFPLSFKDKSLAGLDLIEIFEIAFSRIESNCKSE